MPEAALAGFSFLLHFAWEILQAPFYEGMADARHADATAACLQATLGDVFIALTAFWCAAVVVRRRDWLLEAQPSAWLAYMATGLGITVVLERLATGPLARWAYAGTMPLLADVGLLPLAQWLLVPPVALWLARRHVRGAAP